MWSGKETVKGSTTKATAILPDYTCPRLHPEEQNQGLCTAGEGDFLKLIQPVTKQIKINTIEKEGQYPKFLQYIS